MAPAPNVSRLNSGHRPWRFKLLGVSNNESIVDAARKQGLLERGMDGKLDILVNNAAITGSSSLPHGGPILDIDVADWRTMIDVNLTGAFICSKFAGREMVRQGRGNIVNIASIQGVYATLQSGDYATAKAGLIMLTKVLASELAEHGIRVNAVAPGFIETEMTARMPMGTREVARRINSLQQGGRPVDVAEAIAFLAALRERGIATSLNLHPADGIRPFEEAYERLAKRLGLDPAELRHRRQVRIARRSGGTRRSLRWATAANRSWHARAPCASTPDRRGCRASVKAPPRAPSSRAGSAGETTVWLRV